MPGMATATPDPTVTRRPVWRWALRAVIGIASLALVGEALRVTVGLNFHTVIPGELYRCAQPSERDIESMVRDYGIRTVVNLRGRPDGADWFEAEARVCQRLGVSNEIFTMSAMRVPSRHEVRRLIEILDRAPRPLLLHCRQGADRTGLATAIALCLRPEFPYDDAKSRLGIRCGHWSIGPTDNLSRFFDEYEAWLRSRGETHSSDRFRLWATEFYRAGPASYEIVSAVRVPAEPRAMRPITYRVRFKNTSPEPWVFHSTMAAGIHADLTVLTEHGAHLYSAIAGYLEKTVAPGDEIELTVPVGSLPAGRYLVRIDLREEGAGSFSQSGQEPLEEELIVRE